MFITYIHRTLELLHCHLHVHAEIHIYMLDTYRRNDNDAGRLFYKIFTSHFIVRVRKGCVGFYCERELETEHNWNILTPKLWPLALCFSRSPGLLNRSTGVHSAGCWLSLLQLVYLTILTTTRLTLLTCPLSVQFVGLLLPSNSHAVIWTGLHASAISSNIWRSGCVTSAIFGMACVIVIEQE